MSLTVPADRGEALFEEGSFGRRRPATERVSVGVCRVLGPVEPSEKLRASTVKVEIATQIGTERIYGIKSGLRSLCIAHRDGPV